MNGHAPRLPLLLLLSLPLALAVSPARAADGDKPTETRWVVREGDKEVEIQALKVASGATARYFSGELKAPGKKKRARLVTHLQLDGSGDLHKYKRKLTERNGAGEFAFKKGGAIRIVGVNRKVKAVELAGAQTRPVWDPEAWHILASWTSRLPAGGGPMDILDVAGRKVVRVTTRSEGKHVLGGPAGARVEVQRWIIEGLGSPPLVVLVGPGAKLAGVARGTRRMVLEGHTWEAPAAAPTPEGAPGAEAAPPKAQGDKAGGEAAPKPAAPAAKPAADKATGEPAANPAPDKPKGGAAP